MEMKKETYVDYVQTFSPRSPIIKDCCWAFGVGGALCCLGQAFMDGYKWLGLEKEAAGTAASMSLILLAVLLTGFSLYDNLAKHAGAGTLVPILGFSNSMSAPAIEFRTEGIITGTCVKLFSIAGPVLVFGITASVAYGFLYWLAAGAP